MGYQTSNETAIELYLYASNTCDVWAHVEHAARNLERKRAKGTYSSEKALKMWQHVADHAARCYVREFCAPSEKWHETFSVRDRKDCAIELRHMVEGEWSCGNYWGTEPVA